MSILIRGIDMPEHCGKCKLKAVYDDETFCPFFTDNVEYWIAAERRHEDCPLGPVPPHGRLGDLDALMKGIEADAIWEYDATNEYDSGIRAGARVIMRSIRNAPTIIPAEEGE